ncbi:LAMI_0H13476g1_1 [Lachancea mirantina]|uniref:LAMI_0H13476g1_1 n=1 Tax=Lachancea mirantina TaxID=1230905 RepID=A0A1G4KHY3_9SACH|nr:LAMI_0H13476g1_1 [Lachancea mirantina]
MALDVRFKQILKTDNNVALISGGIAGAVSRTVVSPFERVKILLQVQSTTSAYNQGVFSAVRQVYQEEGVPGLFRGNGLNCVRIFPYSAVQFVVYEACKRQVFRVDGSAAGAAVKVQLENWQRLFAGALCGGCSVLATYPLDLVRARLSIQTANLARLSHSKVDVLRKPPGAVQLLQTIYRDEGGLRALYRGVWPTSVGVVPYVAINFAAYEQLKEFTPSDLGASANNMLKLVFGAVSGGLAQTVTYPFDLLRRRFQVLSMGQNELGFRYKGVWDALTTIGRVEGYRGYYKGLTANLFKVVPSTAVSWLVYEVTCDLLRQS